MLAGKKLDVLPGNQIYKIKNRLLPRHTYVKESAKLKTNTDDKKKTIAWVDKLSFFYFIFMVVGTQDKGRKVSNVQVMPLSLGALPSEEVPRGRAAACTGAAGENPCGDINKEQKRASGGLFSFLLSFTGR